MKRSLLFLFAAFLLYPIIGYTQNTVGTLINTDDALDGYTFFSPFSGTKAYMVDNCGNLINEWDRGTRPGLSAYFLEDGMMLRTYQPDLLGPFTSASNAGGLELVDWDNNTVWKYEINSSDHLSHHDAVQLPNGNFLVLTWKLVYKEDLIEWGRDPEEIAVENYMWSERILEIEPVGTDQASIVWEWNIYDHYIQDFDESKQNYGVINENPQLFNINLPDLNSNNSNSTRDWNHFNAIDYNADLDQVLISVRNSDEIWIIDHSTSTVEAATHVGGKYGKGGDILYRWGNASAYEVGLESDEKLYGQHGVNWIKNGLDDSGKILIFNNGNHQPGPDFSKIEILDPPQDSPGFYNYEENSPYGPDESEIIYGDTNAEEFYSPYLSNAQRLSNGNTLINSGSPGRIFEINSFRQIVWAYEIPLFGDFPATQGDNINGGNSSFRAYKFPIDFSGFEGLDISPGDPIEQNPTECSVTVSQVEIPLETFKIWYNSERNEINFESNNPNIKQIDFITLNGKHMETILLSKGQITYLLSKTIPSGFYIVHLKSVSGSIDSKKIFIP